MGILNYSNDQVKTWLKDKTPDQIAAQAASMGLNQSQINEGLKIGGIGGNTDAERAATIGSYTAAPTSNYSFGSGGVLAQKAPIKAVPGQSMDVNGRILQKQEIADFYKNGGDDVAFAKSMGITDPDQARAMILQARQLGGAPSGDAAVQQAFNRYRAANPNGAFANDYAGWVNDQAPHRLDSIKSGSYTGDGSDQSPLDYKNAYEAGQGGMGWKGEGWGGPSGTGTAGGGATGTPGSTGGATGGTSAGGSTTTSTSGSSAPGNWKVTPDQTVESRIAGILASGNPLVEQRMAQSDMKMNARGLVNSSIAQTASDVAANEAALEIAKPDAATFADAAKTNSLAQTQWGISQMNNQTSRDNTNANIVAQRELQQATQLYNNLATQTSTASSIQQWGLNTITAIQASDLSADAKNAAIANIQQYLADSYTIQGDWHTSAARAIDAIFD